MQKQPIHLLLVLGAALAEQANAYAQEYEFHPDPCCTSPAKQQTTVASGVTQGWAQLGPNSGTPLLVSPGLADSVDFLTFLSPLTPLLQHYNIRMIAVDTPGLSAEATPILPFFDFVTFADRIGALMDALGITHFAVVGTSHTLPQVLALAALLPGRVTSVHSLSGRGQWRVDLSPSLDELENGFALLARSDPYALAPIFEASGDLPIGPALRAVDIDLFGRIPNMLSFLDTFTFPIYDAREGSALLYRGFSDWPFALGNIVAPAYFHYGAEDPEIPSAGIYAADLATRLSGSVEITVYPHEAHLGTQYGHFHQVMLDATDGNRAVLCHDLLGDKQTIILAKSAVQGHLSHGDVYGDCFWH